MTAASTTAACGGAHGSTGNDDARAVAAARSFVSGYVDPDGRVVRRDQGGDTVSEGVGYALLLSVAVGDRDAFDRVWGWASAHLLQPDGLLASHWVNGSVVDPHSAADADTQVAWALARAGRAWGDRYTAAATTMARAIAGTEIGYDDSGHPVLAAGSWAVGGNGRPVVAEPGYWTVPATVALAALTGDHRWQDLGASEQSLMARLTDNGSALPADWTQVGAGRSITAIADPTTGTAPQSGPDGLRAVVWYSLAPMTHTFASSWAVLLRPNAASSPLALHLDGSVVNAAHSPLMAVAAAATAMAAGDHASVDRELDIADGIARSYPTYYGQAWDALGRILLTTDRLQEKS